MQEAGVVLRKPKSEETGSRGGRYFLDGTLCNYCDSMIDIFWDEINRVINTN